MPEPRCVLFFPGSKPELLTKAVASGADVVCVDLEDAVAPEEKDGARRGVVELLAESEAARHGETPPTLAVRINHPATAEGERDLVALEGLDDARSHGARGTIGPSLTVVIPKAGSAEELEAAHARLADRGREVRLIAVVETAAGLAHVEQIAAADGLSAVLLGGLDLSVDLGCALEWEALLYARSRAVHAARLGGVAAIDSPYFDLEDLEGLRAEAERSRRLGFSAKAAVHPRQVSVIRDAFLPDAASVERARRILSAAERERGVTSVDGSMVDRPAVEAARRLVGEADPGEA